MGSSISLRMTSGDDTAVLFDAVAAFVDDHAIGPKPAYALELVLDELVTNIADHGAGPGGATIIIEVVREGATIRGSVRDDAAPFDPLRRGPVDTTGSIEEREVGGLGVHLVRKMTNSLGYSREAGHNVLNFTIEL